jgi:hypothetical protein
MKKIFVLLIILTLTVSFISCENNQQEKNKDELIDKVITLEKNKYKLLDADITYSEFKKNIDGVFTPEFKKAYLLELEETKLLNIDGNIITIKDLENISDEALNSFQEKLFDRQKELGFNSILVTLEVSSSDYKGSLDMKRVYTKKVEKLHLDKVDMREANFYTAYDFKNIDQEWMLASINTNPVIKSKYNETELNKILSRTAFTPENNNEIEYIDSVTLTSRERESE